MKRWFQSQPTHSVCQECGVHFEPYTGEFAEKWEVSKHCAEHRKEALARLRRQEAVCSWARHNWEKVEPLYLEEKQKAYEARQEENQAILNAALQQQLHGGNQSLRQHYPFHGLGGSLGGIL